MLGASASAHADDWLAALSPCAELAKGSSAPRLSLIYPSPGLPAVASPGDRLIVRVRVPSALTPPPGIQQPRALAGFLAELETTALALPPAQGTLALTHAVPVVDVRPDGPTSLVYRATIELPPYMAHGSYALRLHTPFGSVHAARGVRVVAQERTVRLAWLPGGSSVSSLAAAALPIDVLVIAPSTHDAAIANGAEAAAADEAAKNGKNGKNANATPRADEDHPLAPVRLEPSGFAAALRIGARELLVLQGCGSERLAHAIEAVLEHEQRERIALPAAPLLPSGSYQVFEVLEQAGAREDGSDPIGLATGAGPRGLPDARALELEAGSTALTVISRATEPLELLLSAPNARHGYDARPGSPALELSAVSPFDAAAARIAIRARIEPGRRLTLTRKAQASVLADEQAPRLRTEPARIVSGQPFAIEVAGAPSTSRVALALDDGDRSLLAFGAGPTALVLRRPGEHRVRALLIATDGSTRRLEQQLEVVPDRRVGCSVGLPLGAEPRAEPRADPRATGHSTRTQRAPERDPAWTSKLLADVLSLFVLLGAQVLKRRLPGRSGNRLAREPRLQP